MPEPKKRKPAARRKSTRTKRMTIQQRAERQARVVELRLRPMSWAEVAKETGLTERHARRLWAEWRDSEKPALEGLDATDWVIETYHFYEHQIEELGTYALLATVTEEEEPDPVKRAAKERDLKQKYLSPIIGAMNAQRQAREAQKALLQETGYLPHSLGRLQVEVSMKQFVAMVLRVLDDHDATTPELERDLLHELEEAMGRPRAIPAVVDVPPAQRNGSGKNGSSSNGSG